MTESPFTGYALEIRYHNIWLDCERWRSDACHFITTYEPLDDVSWSCVSCDRAGCGCKKAKPSCTDYCECGACDKCQSPHTPSTENETYSSSYDDEDDDLNKVVDNERR